MFPESGREKVKKEGLSDKISFAREDCTSLSFADNDFDAITVAFGIRNFEDLDKGSNKFLTSYTLPQTSGTPRSTSSSPYTASIAVLTEYSVVKIVSLGVSAN